MAETQNIIMELLTPISLILFWAWAISLVSSILSRSESTDILYGLAGGVIIYRIAQTHSWKFWHLCVLAVGLGVVLAVLKTFVYLLREELVEIILDKLEH